MVRRTHSPVHRAAPGLNPDKKAKPHIGRGIAATATVLLAAKAAGLLGLPENTPEGPSQDQMEQVHQLVGTAALRAQNIETGVVIPRGDGLLEVTIHEPAAGADAVELVDETRYVHITQLQETASEIARRYDADGMSYQDEVQFLQAQGSGKGHTLMAGDVLIMPRGTHPDTDK